MYTLIKMIRNYIFTHKHNDYKRTERQEYICFIILGMLNVLYILTSLSIFKVPLTVLQGGFYNLHFSGEGTDTNILLNHTSKKR